MKFLIKKIINLSIKRKIKISVAESCTGGLLSSTITSVSGSSKIFKLGLITYSNDSKIKLLRIPKKLLKKYGAVSEQVCRAMVINVSKISKSKISIAITGIAGPKGGNKKKPVGLVFVGLKKGNKTTVLKYLFRNKGRIYIQKKTVNKCLNLILNILK